MNTKEKHPIEVLGWGIIPIKVYKGCIVEKIIGGYKILGHKVNTPQEIDKIILEAGKSLEKSILKV